MPLCSFWNDSVAYANNVFACVREVASRTEQCWRPIKRAPGVLRVHAHYGSFADYGDADAYGQELEHLRAQSTIGGTNLEVDHAGKV